MEQKNLKTLEFDKICARLQEFAVMDITKDMAAHPELAADLRRAEEMQAETAEAVRLVTAKGTPPIVGKSDIRPSLKRADMDGTLSIRELLTIGQVLQTARRLKSYPDDVECVQISGHIEALYEDKTLERHILDCIVDEETLSDDASPELAAIRRRMRGASSRIRDILQEIVSRRGKCLQEPIITMRGDRYVVPVKSEHKNDIRGIVHDTSATGATLFIEPMAVVETGNEIRMLAGQEADEVERILHQLSGEVAAVAKLLEMTYNTVALLDFIFARAKFSLQYDAYRPKLNDAGIIRLEKARHPLLDPKKVVPTDIYLGADFDTLVVTGPNTGGKTVVLKTLGLLTLMAMAGLHIPAREGSEVSVFTQIFADIGDEQSIEQSLSTFSSHMVNIVDILRKVDDRSLCLFDELGAGTDPVEGAALAVSILEHIRMAGAKAAATTHYSELKLYALSTPRVENASCEFNVETLAPTYRLLIGVPGKSNAFAISQRLGLPQHIIDDASGRIAGENIKFEDILSQLERNRAEAEAERDRALAYKREAELLKDRIARKNESLESRTDKILEKARQEAKRILDEAKAESDAAVRQIREAQKQKDLAAANRAAEEARRKLGEAAKKHRGKIKSGLETPSGNTGAPKSVKLGDDVEIVALGQRGTVATLPDGKGDLYVQVGIMKLKSNLSALRLVAPPKEKKPKAQVRSGGVKTMSVGVELDVRGEDSESAILRVEKFLDDALLSSLHEVRIIHGKGTGVLRSAIHGFLKRQPYVASYRLGGFGEGDTGVTVVELK